MKILKPNIQRLGMARAKCGTAVPHYTKPNLQNPERWHDPCQHCHPQKKIQYNYKKKNSSSSFIVIHKHLSSFKPSYIHKNFTKTHNFFTQSTPNIIPTITLQSNTTSIHSNPKTTNLSPISHNQLKSLL